MSGALYSPEFYDAIRGSSGASADVVAPMVVELLAPRSAVDVGCGDGTWLAALREAGVPDVSGVDGPWIKQAKLKVAAELIQIADFTTTPVRLERRFDLVISLEVAEHLPPAHAERFVNDLTALGSAVLFSAAVPFQGGHGHINEQWPSYWARLFRARGLVPVDCLRPRIWRDDRVAWWYAQNLILYVDAQRAAASEVLSRTVVDDPLPLVHPANYSKKCRPSVSEVAGVLAGAVRRSLAFRRRKSAP